MLMIEPICCATYLLDDSWLCCLIDTELNSIEAYIVRVLEECEIAH